MILFPAIDLVAGRVVRLERGNRARMTVYSDDPVAVAAGFASCGAQWVHVVDLSAAFGEDESARAKNDEAVAGICALGGIAVDVGGGVRSLSRIEDLARRGASRVSVGTAAVLDEGFACAAAASFGDLLAVDVAARDGVARVNGWRDDTGVDAFELASRLADAGFRHLVFTDVARDGMQCGIDVDVYERMAKTVGFPVVASGGVAKLDDIERLASCGQDTVEGCIVGRALYEGAFTLEEALAAARGTDASRAGALASSGAAGIVAFDGGGRKGAPC